MPRLACPALLALVTALATGCAGELPRRSAAGPGALHEHPLGAPEDPTVRGARLVPERLDEGHGWGIAPGGGVRAIVAGVRVVSSPNGAILAATERLPAGPSLALALPERMGGGFLFALGKHVWRADAWLAALAPLFTAPVAVAQVFVGLDRLYVRSPLGTLFAFDPRTGAPAGLGPLPASPSLARLAALDAWHAVAIADLRGALVTSDAGATWRPLALPFQPSDVVALDDAIAVRGVVEGALPGQTEWFEVRPDGKTAPMSSAPAGNERPERGVPPRDENTRPFGPVPLAAAIEDGWPLVDGTALVARDGVLARVRLIDGAIVERIDDAFPLKPARCHPLSRARPGDLGALAFVCGEPGGRTVLYAWDAPNARLLESRRFDGPREVLAFGNGALAARGPCAPDGGVVGRGAVGQQVWCTMSPSSVWRETTLTGEGVDGARIVVLADDRLAVVHPPRREDLATARITLMDGATVSDVPIAFPALREDVAHALRAGVWMDGFEERRPGILGGWIDAAGSVLGVEIAVDGTARIGEYIRDAGAPVASGRWALGWTASRRGFETTDGGMTWEKGLDLPEPISSLRSVRERACGPVGCIAAGWLRVGWGAADAAAPAVPPTTNAPTEAHASPSLTLECQPLGGPVPEPRALSRATASARPARDRSTSGGAVAGAGLVVAPAWGTVSELPGFSGQSGPAMHSDDVGVTLEVTLSLERALRNAPLARVYAWGPNSGEWDPQGRWQVRWHWPWSGWAEARSSATAFVPWGSLDAARRALAIGPAPPTGWTVAAGDDPDHALLLARHTLGVATVDAFVLETDRAPVEIHRPGGEPFPDVEAAIRTGGHWYFATVEGHGESSATVVWLVDGSGAREAARVPRTAFETRPALRFARRADGRALGLVVDGQGDGKRGGVQVAQTVAMRWVVALDLESGSVGDPQPLAPVDLADRPVTLCAGEDAGDDDGWELEAPYPGAVVLRLGTRWTASLQSVVARMRVSTDRACVERVAGSVDAYASAPAGALVRSGPARGPVRPGGDDLLTAKRTIVASVLSARSRYALRCSAR